MKKLDKDWFLYTELVRNSFSEMERAHRVSVELMKYSGQKPYKPSQYLQIKSINGIDIYNPITADYLLKKEGFVLFKKHHSKGLKFFKKTYSVKLPTKEQIKVLSDKYNSEWKMFIGMVNDVWNDEVIKDLGFKNGILAGYAEYEKAYQNEFKTYLNIKEPTTISEINNINRYAPSLEATKRNPNKTAKYRHLFKIGIDLALGKLDEYLVFNENKELKDTKLSLPKLAEKFTLDYQHLKSTLNNYKDANNKAKNLRSNIDVISDVLLHLKTINKEPKEWFLKEFKT